MLCPTCNGMMTESRLKNYNYIESGLEGVTLLNIKKHDCNNCNENVVLFPQPIDLNKKIGIELIKKTTLLTGPEIRFLRKNMGFTAKRLASVMKVNNSSLSRWESGKQKISIQNDLLLRMIYSSIKAKSLQDHLINDIFMQIGKKRMVCSSMTFAYDDHAWGMVV